MLVRVDEAREHGRAPDVRDARARADRAEHLGVSADRDEPVVAAGPRVGIGYAAPPWDTLPWRFWLPESDAVSRPRRAPAADR